MPLAYSPEERERVVLVQAQVLEPERALAQAQEPEQANHCWKPTIATVMALE
jgi:hypothetical protein